MCDMRCYPHYRGHISCEVVTIVIARLRLAAGGTERDPAVSQDSHRVKAAPPGPGPAEINIYVPKPARGIQANLELAKGWLESILLLLLKISILRAGQTTSRQQATCLFVFLMEFYISQSSLLKPSCSVLPAWIIYVLLSKIKSPFSTFLTNVIYQLSNFSIY